jgi:very-short-patch-repair endonuclease/predicted transcriptional regulator of viral defense system
VTGPRRILCTGDEKFVAACRDRTAAELAARQHGVVARRQLVALGITDTAIAYRVRTARLHRLHQGVYAVGHPVLSRHGRWMAATLACGPHAALSHTSAAALWELRPSAATKIDVTVTTAGGRARAGLRIHRVPSLRDQEVTHHTGIPVTTPERTLLDLAATLAPRQIERALDQAEIHRLLDIRLVDDLARTHRNHRGTARLAAALHRHDPGTTLTRSELEEKMLALCGAHDLPRPQVNTIVAGLEVDFLFPAHALAVETDSWQFHRTRSAFERDRHRDAALARAGYRVLRFTDRQLADEPRVIAATLTAMTRNRTADRPG